MDKNMKSTSNVSPEDFLLHNILIYRYPNYMQTLKLQLKLNVLNYYNINLTVSMN